MSSVSTMSPALPSRNPWPLALGIIVIAVMPILTIWISGPILATGLPGWTVALPWLALLVGFGWGAQTRPWIVAAALAPLPVTIVFVAIMLKGWSEYYGEFLSSWLITSLLLLLVFSVLNGLLAALGSWLGYRLQSASA